MRKFLLNIVYLWYRLLNLPSFMINNVSVGNNCHLRGRLYIKTQDKNRSSIIVEDNVGINSSLVSDPIGGETRTILYAAKRGTIRICKGVGLSNTSIVSENSVTIGEYSNIGGGTKIYDTDFHSLDPDIRLAGDGNVKTAPVVIGKKVFVGGHVIILKGVTIGDGAVVGAGSVVSRDIPANEIWCGNPARFIKKVK